MPLSNFIYLAINLFTFTVPFLCAIVYKKKAWVSLKKYGIAMVLVTIPFLIWDGIATYLGNWGFSNTFTVGARFFGLPLEEILFFVTTSYACLFIYEVMKHFVGDEKVKWFDYRIFMVGGGAAMLVGVLALPRYYTATIFLFLGIFLLWCAFARPAFVQMRSFWLYLLISYIPFFIVNGILTALPIVWYSPAAILNIRAFTIPIEDFFYNFLMLALYLGLYVRVK